MKIKFVYRFLMLSVINMGWQFLSIAQTSINDTIIRPTTESPASPDSTIENKRTTHSGDSTSKESWREFVNYFRLDFFTTINAFHYLNSRDQNVDRNNFYIYYNINIANQFKTKYVLVNAYFFNELGYRKYVDSIHMKNDDLYYYKFDINSPILKDVNFNISYQVKSQLWKSWQYKMDSLHQTKESLFSSYFSPGYIIYSAGLSYDFWRTAKFEVGLVGGQITKIRNQKLYESRNEQTLYGIEKGKRKQVEFGLTAQLQMPIHKIGRFFYWENSSRVFVKGKEIGQERKYQVDISNGFHFLFFKYMRIGLRTKLNYDKNISSKMFISNMLLFGFYLSNKL